MHSVQLREAISDYLRAAAALLGAELAAGAEIPFEVEQQPGAGRRAGGSTFYCYRPLTSEFLAARRPELEALAEYERASRQLATFEGRERYLVSVGEDITRLTPSAQVRAAIGSLLGEVFGEQSDFELREERLEAALERLQGAALAATAEVTIVARLLGMTLSSSELALAKGLTIARPEALEGLPPEARTLPEDGPGHLIVALASSEPDPAEALLHGREVLRELLRALRLFGDGRVTLGAVAWARIGGGRWNPLALGGGGRPHGMLVVTPEHEDELRAFCNLVARRAPEGDELAWALRRFEMGCEREDPYEALSDNLMALRALLEPEGPASGMLPGRLAALCATPERRLALTERAVQAIVLERAVISGSAGAEGGAAALVHDIGDHLRALLRDVICGHLAPDLVALADELLLSEPPAEDAAAPQAPAPRAMPFEVPGTIPLRASDARGVAHEADSEAELIGDAGEAEEILDLLI